MKKIILSLFCCFLSLLLFSQAVAVDDFVQVTMGDTITFNPIKNDYDTMGYEIKILDVRIHSASKIKLIEFNDSLITFTVPSYFLPNDYSTIFYQTIEGSQYHSEWGKSFVRLSSTCVDSLNINNINTVISPSNVQFLSNYYGDVWQWKYEYPRNSKRNTLFSHSFWIGGKNANGELCFSGETSAVNGPDYWTGPLSNDGLLAIDSTTAGNWFRTWKVSKEEIQYHIHHFNDPDYEIPYDISEWPAHGDINLNQNEYLAPFVDVDLNSIYEPENGDYPLAKGDMSIFFIYNDSITHFDSYGKPLGIEVHCLAWAFEDSDENEEFNNTIFFDYKIFNRSQSTYDSTYIGLYTYFELGFAYDNYIGCDVENGYIYSYNGDDFDEDYIVEDSTYNYGYYENIPAQGVCVLGGPLMDSDQADNVLGQCNEGINGIGFGDDIIDNERFGMTNFYQYINWGGMFPDPFHAEERYNFTHGYLFDNIYGDENGVWRFMYPGESDSCDWGFNGLNPNPEIVWSEETSGNQPGERIGIIGIGPFTFEAGTVEYLDIALVTAPGDQEVSSKDLLQDYVAAIRADYMIDPEEFGNQYLGEEDISKISEEGIQIFPNPVNGDQFYIQLPMAERGEYAIYNSAGQRVQEGFLSAQKQQQIDIAQLDHGWYVLEVKMKDKTYRTKLIK